MNNFFLLFGLLIAIFFLASCSNKNNKIAISDENSNAIEQPSISVETNDARKNIDVHKIMNSVAWNTDQQKIDELTIKFDENRLTDDDKKYIRSIYHDFIEFGSILYPEAAIILSHYIDGDGSDITIESDYFFQTAVVKNALEEKKNIIGPIIIKTNDDPRLGYAINGFYIKNDQNDMQIYQTIEFGGRNNKEAYTPLRIPMKNTTINLPHRLIRVFEETGGCKSFTVRIIKKQ
jgi:hypothetical protein